MKQLPLLLAVLINTSMANSQTKITQSNSLTMDKQTIIQTITTIFSGSDQRQWQHVAGSFANEVILDYTSMAGGTPATVSPQQIITAWQAVLPGFQSTHHQVGNFTVTVTGNKAIATHHGLALHWLPNESGNNVWVVVGTYDYTLIKKDDTWKVTGMKFNLQKQEGNLQLPVLAGQLVKEGKKFTPESVAPANKQVIEYFFTALESMNISSFLEVWADDGVQYMPLSPAGFPAKLEGKAAIHRQYKDLPANYTSMHFPRKYFATGDQELTIVQYSGSIPLKDGGEYNNNYVGLFRIRNGKLQEFTEYFDPFLLEAAFGNKLQSNFNTGTAITAATRKVEFKSEGLVLTGTLHLPADFDEQKNYKTVIVTGSWLTVKEQMPDYYARKLAARGLIAFTFDFRNYGESEGQPRYYEVPAMKSRDIEQAARYLQTLSFVNGKHINGLAICASSGYMADAIIQGASIRSLVMVAPWLHNHAIVREVYGGEEAVSSRIAQAIEAKKKFAATGEVQHVAAASDTDSSAAMFGPFDYYLNTKRGAVPAWGNHFALMNWQGWLEYDPVAFAPSLTVPTLIIHSRTGAVPQGAELFYNNLRATKQLIWIDGATQFDFYDGEAVSDQVVKEAVGWFGKD